MIKYVLVALSVTMGLNAQTPGPFGGMVDAYTQAIRLQNEQRAVRAQEELMHSESEAIRARTEQLRLNNALAVQRSAASAQLNQDFPAAAERIMKRFPDFNQYSAEAGKLIRDFGAPLDGTANLDHYLEGLYLIAKYASFSPVAKPLPENCGDSPASKLVGDPDFHKLSMPLKVKLLRDVDSVGLAPFKDEEIETILLGIAAKTPVGGK